MRTETGLFLSGAVIMIAMVCVMLWMEHEHDREKTAWAAERDSLINHAAAEMRTARLQMKLADGRIHDLEWENTELRIKHGEPLDSMWVWTYGTVPGCDTLGGVAMRVAGKDTAKLNEIWSDFYRQAWGEKP